MTILLIILSILISLLIVKKIIIKRLRKKRDVIDFTTNDGVDKIMQINKKIDRLNGYF